MSLVKLGKALQIGFCILNVAPAIMTIHALQKILAYRSIIKPAFVFYRYQGI